MDIGGTLELLVCVDHLGCPSLRLWIYSKTGIKSLIKFYLIDFEDDFGEGFTRFLMPSS